MCHQAVEKILKAYFVFKHNATPRSSRRGIGFILEPVRRAETFSRNSSAVQHRSALSVIQEKAFRITDSSTLSRVDTADERVCAMDQQSAIAAVEKYAVLVRKHFPVLKVILVGSYARGDQRVHSDIDVAVVVEKLEGDFLTSAALAQRLIRDIDLSIEPILLVDEYDPSGFLAHIESTGITVYSAAPASVGK